MIDFKNKTVLITGGGSGIGRAIAEAFGAAGARVAIAEIDPERAAEARVSLEAAGVEALVIQADVTRLDDVQRLTTVVEQTFGGLDVLVNNVGDYLMAKPFEQFSDDETDRLYALNLRHIFGVTRAMLPLLRRNGAGGSIISISSIEGIRGDPACAIYAAFKAAVGGFSRTLAIPDVNKHHIPRWIPLARFGQPQDCAGAALYLASPLAAWMRDPTGAWTTIPLITGNGFVGIPTTEQASAT